jgi:hypothetical protein
MNAAKIKQERTQENMVGFTPRGQLDGKASQLIHEASALRQQADELETHQGAWSHPLKLGRRRNLGRAGQSESLRLRNDVQTIPDVVYAQSKVIGCTLETSLALAAYEHSPIVQNFD